MLRHFLAACAIFAFIVPVVAFADDAVDDPDAVTITEEDGNGFFGHTCKYTRGRLYVYVDNGTDKNYNCDIYCTYKTKAGADETIKCVGTVSPDPNPLPFCIKGARNFEESISTRRECTENRG